MLRPHLEIFTKNIIDVKLMEFGFLLLLYALCTFAGEFVKSLFRQENCCVATVATTIITIAVL